MTLVYRLGNKAGKVLFTDTGASRLPNEKEVLKIKNSEYVVVRKDRQTDHYYVIVVRAK